MYIAGRHETVPESTSSQPLTGYSFGRQAQASTDLSHQQWDVWLESLAVTGMCSFVPVSEVTISDGTEQLLPKVQVVQDNDTGGADRCLLVAPSLINER